jgi:hypothetical protein
MESLWPVLSLIAGIVMLCALWQVSRRRERAAAVLIEELSELVQALTQQLSQFNSNSR